MRPPAIAAAAGFRLRCGALTYVDAMRSMFQLRKTLTSLALAIALGGVATSAMAADSQGRYLPKGFGLDRCKDFSAAAKQGEEKVLPIASWLNGYITAFNTFNNDVYDVAPWQREGVLLSIIAGYCDTHAEEPLATVAQKLMASFMPTRLSNLSQPIEAKSGDQTVRVFPEVLKQAQDALIKEGMLTGTSDGSFGPKTKTAFESFQAKAGIKKSGLPDQETLFRLFADVSAPTGAPPAAGTSGNAGGKSGAN
ncbi:Putative peptidoglycan binding domain-containing protein [Arboricoccus pini]|uniref:Putative peptidoglycan binding domain-containing protein n=1 Tax=Arboricoccus pini TaxID=1963835 RepID=A0A212PZR3_9PROT|nr:Putative peptidoglycan binding domain-containing protein [Arboricoccus pini]